jgi:tetratricopeptide (TPR) repeat protein
MKRLALTLVSLMVAGILGAGGAAILWGKTRHVPDLVKAANAAYSRGDWARTDALARQRLKQAPDDPKALQLAARAAAHQARDPQAIAIYSRLILEDMDAEDLFLLGRALGRTGKFELAFKTYERGRLVNPDYPDTLDALAELYLQHDRENAAEEAALRLIRQPRWEARGLLILGTARAELHDPSGSVQALRRWLELDPQGRAAAPRPVLPFRLLLARSLLRSRQTAPARQLLEDVLAHEPNPEAWWLLSRCYIQQKDWDRAARAVARSASFRSEHPLEPEPAPYVGEARCAACHAEICRSTAASKHTRTFSRGQELDKLELPSKPLPDPANPQVTHAFLRRDGLIQVETRVADLVQRAVVDFAFGSPDQFMTLVGRDDRGRTRMLRLSHYQSSRGSGWDLSTGLAPRPEDPQEYLGKTMLEGDGLRRCLFCHTTNARAVLDRAGPEAADRAIGCEKCHGPGGHHLTAAAAGFSDLAILNPGRLSGPAANKTCGQCHDLHDTSVISAPRTDPVWYRFQALALTWSRCYTQSEGRLKCLTCHDPHQGGETPAARHEARCLACHGAGKMSCPVDPAQGCIACHMPSAWQQSTHSFKTDHFIRVRDRLSPVRRSAGRTVPEQSGVQDSGHTNPTRAF